MNDSDPFAGIPNADDDEYAGTVLATERETVRRILAARYGPGMPVTDAMVTAVIAAAKR